MRNIYDNFEKHKLPVKNAKDMQTELRRLTVATTTMLEVPNHFKRA